MIIRVLHEGQYEVTNESVESLNSLDEQMFQAVVAGDSSTFSALFAQVLAIVRDVGRPLAVDDLRASDLVLPASDSTLDEVRSLFAQEGLIGSA